MTRYRKKPVEVDAMWWSGSESSAYAIVAWAQGGVRCRMQVQGPTLEISTLEGTMTVSPGDYVIRGIKGEFYPCKPDIFTSTYEAVEFSTT